MFVNWPLYWPAHLNKGELLREQGDLDGAVREQEQVLEQDRQNAYGLASLARAYIDAADLQKARQTLARARKEDRQNYTLRQTWAVLLALEGRKSDAAQEMDSGLQAYAAIQIFGPSRAADYYAVMDEAETALDWLDRAVRLGDYRGVPAPEPVAEGPSRASPVSADSRLRDLPPPATRASMTGVRHSLRMAITGSILVARRAGNHEAHSATSSRAADTAM